MKNNNPCSIGFRGRNSKWEKEKSITESHQETEESNNFYILPFEQIPTFTYFMLHSLLFQNFTNRNKNLNNSVSISFAKVCCTGLPYAVRVPDTELQEWPLGRRCCRGGSARDGARWEKRGTQERRRRVGAPSVGRSAQLAAVHQPGAALSDLSEAAYLEAVLRIRTPVLSSRKYDPKCSSWIRIPDLDLDFLHIPDPGSAKLLRCSRSNAYWCELLWKTRLRIFYTRAFATGNGLFR